jgi:hypothetical protein
MDLFVANNMLQANNKKEEQNGTSNIVITPGLVVQAVLFLIFAVLAAMLSWKTNTEINTSVGTIGKVFYAFLAFVFSTIYYIWFGIYYGLNLGKTGICK